MTWTDLRNAEILEVRKLRFLAPCFVAAHTRGAMFNENNRNDYEQSVNGS